MKPRITMGDTCVWIGTWFYLSGWYCTDGIWREWGATPKEAYDAWRTKSTAPRRVFGQIVEQHMCPPKPTLWQRIKRGWDSFDLDTSARVL